MKIEKIHIFPHSKSKIPTRLKKYIRKDLSAEKIEETIEYNRDINLESIISRAKLEKNSIVLAYPYTRLLGDSNRILAKHQFPENIYYGEHLIDIKNDLAKVREISINEYVQPWQDEVIKTCVANPDAQIIHWHSMNTYSLGKSNMNTNPSQTKDIRPTGQIITRVDTKYSSILKNNDSRVLESILLSKEALHDVLNLLQKNMHKYDKHLKNWTYDNPYKLFGIDSFGERIFGPSLVSLTSYHTSNKLNQQLIVEVRRDVVQDAKTQEIFYDTVSQCLDLMKEYS